MRTRHVAVTLLLVALSAISITAAPSGPRAFANNWEGRTVALTRPLFSLVFDERSRALPLFKRQGRIAGLTVGTPSDIYYQFDARRESEDDIIDRDPDRLEFDVAPYRNIAAWLARLAARPYWATA